MTWTECACGGVVMARSSADIPTAMARHVQEARHLLWQLANLRREFGL